MGNILVDITGCEFNAEELGFVSNVVTGGWYKICASWGEVQEVASRISPTKGKYLDFCKDYNGEARLFDLDGLVGCILLLMPRTQ